MDPIQFLRLAEWLLRTQSHPAGCRSAVSRAYYAVHHFVKEFVESTGVQISKGAPAHSDVWNHLASLGDPEIEQIGSDLADLHSSRIDADYRLQDARIQGPKTAAVFVEHAKNLIDLVKAARDDKSRYDQLKIAIISRNAYLRGLAQN